MAKSHKIHAGWTLAMTPRQTTAFPRGACGHAMQELGWILLQQLSIWESLHQPAPRLALWASPSTWTERDLHRSCRSAALEVQSLRLGGAKFPWCPVSHEAHLGSDHKVLSHPWGKDKVGCLLFISLVQQVEKPCEMVVSSLVIIITFCMVVVLAVQRFFCIWRTCETPINMPFFVSRNFPSKGILLTNFCKGEGNGWDNNLQLLLHRLLGRQTAVGKL